MRGSLGWILFGRATARPGGRERARGKDSCRSTKQLILSPGGIFYGRYNLQDASLKATRVYQRKPLPSPSRLGRGPFPPPSLVPCRPYSLVSRRYSPTRLCAPLTPAASTFLTAPESLRRRCSLIRVIFHPLRLSHLGFISRKSIALCRYTSENSGGTA